MPIRTMEKQKPPVRFIVPGKVIAATIRATQFHSPFHQIEGLASLLTSPSAIHWHHRIIS